MRVGDVTKEAEVGGRGDVRLLAMKMQERP